jgi:hypothetical protein
VQLKSFTQNELDMVAMNAQAALRLGADQQLIYYAYFINMPYFLGCISHQLAVLWIFTLFI